MNYGVNVCSRVIDAYKDIDMDDCERGDAIYHTLEKIKALSFPENNRRWMRFYLPTPCRALSLDDPNDIVVDCHIIDFEIRIGGRGIKYLV